MRLPPLRGEGPCLLPDRLINHTKVILAILLNALRFKMNISVHIFSVQQKPTTWIEGQGERLLPSASPGPQEPERDKWPRRSLRDQSL